MAPALGTAPLSLVEDASPSPHLYSPLSIWVCPSAKFPTLTHHQATGCSPLPVALSSVFSAYTSHQTRAITDTRTAHCHHQSSMSPGKDLATFTRKLMSGYSTCSIIPGCRPGWWEEERLH